MASIQELIPYLKQGFTLMNIRGESIRPIEKSGNVVEWSHHTWSGRLETEKCSQATVANVKDIWPWGAVFCSKDGKNPYILTELPEIEAAIKNNVPRAVYGGLPGE